MSATELSGKSVATKRSRGWWLIATAAGVCVASWIALGVGLYVGAGFTPRLVLVSMAAISSEALVWIVAAVLGLRVFEARRRIAQRLRDTLRR